MSGAVKRRNRSSTSEKREALDSAEASDSVSSSSRDSSATSLAYDSSALPENDAVAASMSARQQQHRHQKKSEGKLTRLQENPTQHHWHRPVSSLLSSASDFKNYRGLFNNAMIILVLSNLRMIVENISKYGVLVNPLKWFSWMLEDPYTWPNLLLSFSLNISILVAFYLEKQLAARKISESRGRFLHCLNIFLEIAFPIVVVYVVHPNPVGSILVIGHTVIVWLKLVSWVMFNLWCREERDAIEAGKLPAVTMADRLSEFERITKNYETEIHHQKKKFLQHHQQQQQATDGATTEDSDAALKSAHHEWESSEIDFTFDPPLTYPNNLTLPNLYYFMFAPTLCYELNFPRTKSIRWRFLARRLVETTVFAILLFALGEQWIVPTVKNSMKPLQHLDTSMVIERVLKLAIPNHFLWLIFFYWYFHCLLNAIAEVMRFADREFYRDWWNATTIQYFWRNWNIPVHKWCARHFYLPLMRHGVSRATGWVCVFLLSALFHEILVSVPLGMFKIWSFAAMMGQIPLAIITEKFFKGSQYGNVLMWFSLVLGQPIAILMYVYDYLVIHNKI